MDLQEEMDLALIFIAHDLSVVKHISTKIMVLYLGNMVELANSEDIYKAPSHPYTQALISAVPIPDPSVEKNKDLILIEGELPSPINPPSGCVFRTRCHKAQEVCAMKSLSLRAYRKTIVLLATSMINYLKKRIKNKWLLIVVPFLFFLIKGLIWLAIFYGLWDLIKS